MVAIVNNLRCMMCGHEFQETLDEGDDKERTCPACRSNSIRVLKPVKPAQHAQHAQPAKAPRKG